MLLLALCLLAPLPALAGAPADGWLMLHTGDMQPWRLPCAPALERDRRRPSSLAIAQTSGPIATLPPLGSCSTEDARAHVPSNLNGSVLAISAINACSVLPLTTAATEVGVSTLLVFIDEYPLFSRAGSEDGELLPGIYARLATLEYRPDTLVAVCCASSPYATDGMRPPLQRLMPMQGVAANVTSYSRLYSWVPLRQSPLFLLIFRLLLPLLMVCTAFWLIINLRALSARSKTASPSVAPMPAAATPMASTVRTTSGSLAAHRLADAVRRSFRRLSRQLSMRGGRVSRGGRGQRAASRVRLRTTAIRVMRFDAMALLSLAGWLVTDPIMNSIPGADTLLFVLNMLAAIFRHMADMFLVGALLLTGVRRQRVRRVIRFGMAVYACGYAVTLLGVLAQRKAVLAMLFIVLSHAQAMVVTVICCYWLKHRMKLRRRRRRGKGGRAAGRRLTPAATIAAAADGRHDNSRDRPDDIMGDVEDSMSPAALSILSAQMDAAFGVDAGASGSMSLPATPRPLRPALPAPLFSRIAAAGRRLASGAGATCWRLLVQPFMLPRRLAELALLHFVEVALSLSLLDMNYYVPALWACIWALMLLVMCTRASRKAAFLRPSDTLAAPPVRLKLPHKLEVESKTPPPDAEGDLPVAAAVAAAPPEAGAAAVAAASRLPA